MNNGHCTIFQAKVEQNLPSDEPPVGQAVQNEQTIRETWQNHAAIKHTEQH